MVTRVDDGLDGLLAPSERQCVIGVMPNRAHQKPRGFMQGSNFQLGVVEFDDQGRCYEREQLDRISEGVEALRKRGEDVILVVFVHGWKHDARSDDANLTSFRRLLKRTAEYEARGADADGARPVMGVFVGWRGMTAHGVGDLVADLTFWGRQAAAHRVATGSVRELFGRLRHYRNARRKRGGSPLLVVAGHSFGGMIVFSALAQSLIEAASAPTGRIIPGFADLVLLANPAIEGAGYLPIYDLVDAPAFKARTDQQLPVFICIQARNDQPVGFWFPVGNVMNRLGEATIGDLEKRCVTHAIGFIREYRTHRIAGPSTELPFILTPPRVRQPNPYWIIAAEKAVIDGHDGIWREPFLSFLAAILFQHVNVSRGDAGALAAPIPSPGGGSPPLAAALSAKEALAPASTSGDLADFARQIGAP